MAGLDLAKVVSVTRPTSGTRPSGSWARATALQKTPKYHVVAFDYGVKKNILRMLAERGCKVTVVPAQTPAPKC
jgi:carbamoyl-phosphate synthase small subunit